MMQLGKGRRHQAAVVGRGRERDRDRERGDKEDTLGRAERPINMKKMV